MDGIINLIKPMNMTSHDVVSIVRKKLKTKRVGHTGTLDPMATGVLPICVGQATRVVEYIVSDKKKYQCELTLGIETDTQDIWGKVLETREVAVTEEDIRKAVSEFIGDIQQLPPMYSAIRVDGRRLYEYAREGQQIERSPRQVTIYNINILSMRDSHIILEIDCSKGTYIRTLCHDIGKKLGCLGVMSSLQRLQSGIFSIENGITIDQLDTLPPEAYMIAMDKPLTQMGEAEIKNEQGLIKAGHGASLSDEEVIWKNRKELNKIYYNNCFIAIAEYNEENAAIQMKKVFNNQ